MKALIIFFMTLSALASDPITVKMNQELSRLEQLYLKKQLTILKEAQQQYNNLKVKATKAGNLELAIQYKQKSERVQAIIDANGKPQKTQKKIVNYASDAKVLVSTKRGNVNPKWPLESIIDGVSNSPTNYTAVSLPAEVIVDLGQSRAPNKLNIHLFDYDDRVYRYIVKTSSDGVRWITISDTRKDSKGLQSFKINHRFRYISIVGTHNSVNSSFHIKEVEVIGVESTCK